jgi:hypothetical protein
MREMEVSNDSKGIETDEKRDDTIDDADLMEVEYEMDAGDEMDTGDEMDDEIDGK